MNNDVNEGERDRETPRKRTRLEKKRHAIRQICVGWFGFGTALLVGCWLLVVGCWLMAVLGEQTLVTFWNGLITRA